MICQVTVTQLKLRYEYDLLLYSGLKRNKTGIGDYHAELFQALQTLHVVTPTHSKILGI